MYFNVYSTNLWVWVDLWNEFHCLAGKGEASKLYMFHLRLKYDSTSPGLKWDRKSQHTHKGSHSSGVSRYTPRSFTLCLDFHMDSLKTPPFCPAESVRQAAPGWGGQFSELQAVQGATEGHRRSLQWDSCGRALVKDIDGNKKFFVCMITCVHVNVVSSTCHVTLTVT